MVKRRWLSRFGVALLVVSGGLVGRIVPAP